METIPGARARGSLVRRLFFEGKAPGTRLGYISADWFVAVDVLIYHILMIPNKDAPGSWQLYANSRVIWLCTWVRYWPGRGLVYVPTLSPGRANCYKWGRSIEIIALSRVTTARNFDEGAAQRIKKNGVGNHLHGMWINSIFCRYFQENLKPRATFLSGARQPEVDFLHTWAMILNKFWGKSSL